MNIVINPIPNGKVIKPILNRELLIVGNWYTVFYKGKPYTSDGGTYPFQYLGNKYVGWGGYERFGPDSYDGFIQLNPVAPLGSFEVDASCLENQKMALRNICGVVFVQKEALDGPALKIGKYEFGTMNIPEIKRALEDFERATS